MVEMIESGIITKVKKNEGKRLMFLSIEIRIDDSPFQCVLSFDGISKYIKILSEFKVDNHEDLVGKRCIMLSHPNTESISLAPIAIAPNENSEMVYKKGWDHVLHKKKERVY